MWVFLDKFGIFDGGEWVILFILAGFQSPQKSAPFFCGQVTTGQAFVELCADQRHSALLDRWMDRCVVGNC